MTKSPAVFFSLNTQFQNLGDCVINELLLRELATQAEIHILGRRTPQWMQKRLAEVPSIHIGSSLTGWIARLFKSVLLRRTIFAFKPGHFAISARPKSILYSLLLLIFCGTLRLFGGEVIRVGISIEPLDPLQQKLLAWLGNLHSLFGVRDMRSLEYGRSIGIDHIAYSPDLAFLLARGWPGCDAVGLEQPPGQPRERLSISFRQDAALAKEEYRVSMSDRVGEYAKASGLTPVVSEQVGYDEAISQDLAERLKCQRVRFVQDDPSANAIFENYQHSQFVVSNRLHSLLFGWSAGAIPVPLIVASKHSKIGDLFRSLQIHDLVLTWEDLDKLPQHLSAIHERAEQWRERLKVAMDQQCQTLATLLRENSARRT